MQERTAVAATREPALAPATAVLAALFVAAVALRPQVVAVGPLLPEMQREIGLSHLAGGLLSSIPILCMGVFAPSAGRLVRWWGTRVAVAGSLALIAAFGVLRGFAPSGAWLIALTVPIGIGTAQAQALLPVVVKELLAGRPAFATGVYSTGLQLGAAGAAGTAVPLAAHLGGWPAPLVVVSATTAAIVVAWLWLIPARETAAPRVVAARVRLRVRGGFAWLLALGFGLQSMIFYGLSAWLAAAFVERGWSDRDGGLLTTVVAAAAVPAGLVLPWLADRRGSRRVYLLLAAGALLLATAGFAAAPGGAWVWAGVAGAGCGISLPLMLTLPVDAAVSPGDVGALTALMLLGGYALSAFSPALLGAVRDATGGFTVALWLLVVFAAAFVAVAATLSPQRLRRAAASGAER